MFNSIFSQKWFQWMRGPSSYIVNLQIKIDGEIIYKDVQVFARSRYEAYNMAIARAKEEVSILVTGSKSLGKVNSLNQLLNENKKRRKQTL